MIDQLVHRFTRLHTAPPAPLQPRLSRTTHAQRMNACIRLSLFRHTCRGVHIVAASTRSRGTSLIVLACCPQPWYTPSTMIFLDAFFLMLGLGVLCRVFFMSLMYALPTAVGLTTLFAAYNFIGSVIAAGLIAITAGTLTLRGPVRFCELGHQSRGLPSRFYSLFPLP